jgi:hypothetical protein
MGAAIITRAARASVPNVEWVLRGLCMRRAWFFAVLVAAVLGGGASSPAQDQRSRGNDACTADSAKICKKFFGQGDMVILNCFQSNRTKLSGNCRKFLTQMGLLN